MAKKNTRHCRNCGDETTGPYCDDCHALYLADAAALGDSEDASAADDVTKETVR